MTKHLEPEVVDPRELEPGDEVGCVNGGRGWQVLAGDPRGTVDVFWVALHNEPGATTQLWGEPVPAGSVALKLGSYDHDWKVAVLPRVWARRMIK